MTGTFDNWAKSEKLDRVGEGFEKTIHLSRVDDKILYKFVVDGTWTTDHLAPSETDGSGIVNNILLRHQLSEHHPTISSVAPASTTAALAGQVPHESQRGPSSELPGQFPETPANEPQSFSVNPIPASSGAGNPVSLAPGEKVPHPSSYTAHTLDSNVKLDQESYERGGAGASSLPSEQTFSVNPIPATAGAGNPVHLAPGEKVPAPSSYTTGTLGSNIKLDQESYEKSGSTVPQLPPVLDSQEQREAEGASIFGLPAIGGTMIPESSLPMGNDTRSFGDMSHTVSSVAPQSTTAELAGQQPIEPRGVPAVVTDSQQEAMAPAEAASSRQAVQDKSAVEDELKDSVPEAPATSESGLFGKSEGGLSSFAVGGLAALGATITGAAYAARDKLAEATGELSDPTISSAAPQSTTADLAGKQPLEERGVPEVVSESQQSAHTSPEAAGSTQAVKDKSLVEEELKEKVPEAPATAESGITSTSGERGVPEVVTESQQTAHASPEAAGSTQAVQDKSLVEEELKEKVPKAPATTESGLMGTSERGVVGAAAGGVAAVGATIAGAAYAARDKAVGATGQHSGNILPVSVQDTDSKITSQPQQSTGQVNGVPELVTESQQQAHFAPEASANPTAVREKAAVEKELERKVSPVEEAGVPVPTESAALSSTAPAASSTTDSTPAVPTGSANTPGRSTLQTPPQDDSRDVSPMTRAEGDSAMSTTPAVSAAPSTPKKSGPLDSVKNTPDRTAASDTGSPADSKKSKRKSFFGRIKEKLRS